MAETLRNLTLSLLILILPITVPATVLTGVKIVSTSGTLTMQRIEAERVTVGKDQEIVIAEDLQLTVLMESGETAHVRADKGVVVMDGDTRLGERLMSGGMSAEKVQRYGQQFRTIKYPGDFQLLGEETDVTAEIGERGSVRSREMIWSELLSVFLFPREFKQTATLETGDQIYITGGAASVTRAFDDWIYFGSDNVSPAIEYERPLESAGTKDRIR